MRNNNLHMRRTMFREVSKINRQNSRNSAKYDDTKFIRFDGSDEKPMNEFSDKVIFVVEVAVFSFIGLVINSILW